MAAINPATFQLMMQDPQGLFQKLWAPDTIATILAFSGMLDVAFQQSAPTDTNKLWFDPFDPAEDGPGTFKIWDGTSAWVTMTFPRFAEWLARRGAYDGNPPGTVLMYGGATAPAGYLLCQGQAISRTTYARLFSAIGTAFGSGNGTSTFNVPDTQDEFPRGARIAGNARPIGKKEADALKAHTHLNGVANNSAGLFVYGGSTQDMPGAATAQTSSSTAARTHQGLTSSTGDTETRPRNIAFNFIIRF